MTLAHSDEWLDVYAGDAREILATLPADSVDCVVTSPPYWGLRDYGTADWDGGDPECEHKAPDWTEDAGDAGLAEANVLNANRAKWNQRNAGKCPECGAIRVDRQIGLEGTPDEYVANMVAVFAEVRRVLKPTGTVWLNLGDSYGAGGGAQVVQTKNASHGLEGMRGAKTIAPKQLAGIPWRVAFALQADGWYLRSDIIWAKKNGMPESVTDRPTRAHEYIFLLTQSARYFYDIDAVRQEPAPATVQRLSQNDGHPNWNGHRDRGFPGSDQTIDINKMLSPGGANLRDVWWMATMPYPDAHFAVFPPELPEKCIKAGSSEKGVCPECGVPWRRTYERTEVERADFLGSRFDQGKTAGRLGGDRAQPGPRFEMLSTGWEPGCLGHDGKAVPEPIPATILDPFAGSGTTGMVANHLSRRAILIDLNPDYITQQMKRNANLPLGLTA